MSQQLNLIIQIEGFEKMLPSEQVGLHREALNCYQFSYSKLAPILNEPQASSVNASLGMLSDHYNQIHNGIRYNVVVAHTVDCRSCVLVKLRRDESEEDYDEEASLSYIEAVQDELEQLLFDL